MKEVFILARTSNGQLWQAMHIGDSPTWEWLRATESMEHIMGHLVLTIPFTTALPHNPGEITSAMLPGAAGEGVTHP